MGRKKDVLVAVPVDLAEICFAKQAVSEARESLHQAERRLVDARKAAEQTLTPLLTARFGAVILQGLRSASAANDKECPEDNGWVMTPYCPQFMVNWNAPANRDLKMVCQKIGIDERRAVELILGGLVKAGKVEEEDGGSVLFGEQFGGYGVYRIARKK